MEYFLTRKVKFIKLKILSKLDKKNGALQRKQRSDRLLPDEGRRRGAAGWASA